MPALEAPRPEPGTYGYTAGVDAVFEDGSLLGYPGGWLNIESGPGPAWYEHLLLRFGPTAESWDTLGTFVISQQYWTGTRQEQLWFAPLAVSAVAGDELYFSRGDDFEILRYAPDGSVTQIIRRSPRAPHGHTRVAGRAT